MKTQSENLNELVKDLEVGTFSSYQTTFGRGQDIPFEKKPAQQFLGALGVTDDQDAKLSMTSDRYALSDKKSPDVSVSSFDDNSTTVLKITGARSDELLASAKTYVNEDIISAAEFAKVVAPGILKAQTKGTLSTGEYLQNLAVGICHAQKVDLLAEPSINPQGGGILGPRSGSIDTGAPAMLLLSSPALNVAYGLGEKLTQTKKVQYIEGMYRNLFNAATQEEYKYIALPPAGLGVFGGDPETYFTALMKIAKEFPNLNIIYNSGDSPTKPTAVLFDQLLKDNEPTNLVRTDKDVLFVAHKLTQTGKPCAFHNPSDADVVLGIYDVGEYWKNGTGTRYVAEEHIGAMTTAPINSRALNPKAYENVVACSFLKELQEKLYTSAPGQKFPQPEGATSGITMLYKFANPNPESTPQLGESNLSTPQNSQAVLFSSKDINTPISEISAEKLMSKRTLPFEKFDKHKKQIHMNKLIAEIKDETNPSEIEEKLKKLFKVACTVRNRFSLKKFDVNTHSASELRAQLLSQSKILNFLGLNEKATDEDLKKLMAKAIHPDQEKNSTPIWTAQEPTSGPQKN